MQVVLIYIMSKICDHKSVGMFVWESGKLLLIERGRPPYGFAVPAGHVDDDLTYEDAAKRELKEEVGLDTDSLELIKEGKKENYCRRKDGAWHYWKLFKIVSSGEIVRSEDETKQAVWYTVDRIKGLASRTEIYLQGKISDGDWRKNPGLEPVMYEWFKELKII